MNVEHGSGIRFKLKEIKIARQALKQELYGKNPSAKENDRSIIQSDPEAGEDQLSLDLQGGRNRTPFKRALEYITENASKIASVTYTTGNVLLTAKAGIHPDLDTVSGAFFDVTSAALYFGDKYPTATYRVAGATGLLATAALSAKGINFDTGQIADWARVVSPVGLAATFTLTVLQKEIAQLAKKGETSKNRLKRAFAATLTTHQFESFPRVVAVGDKTGSFEQCISARG